MENNFFVGEVYHKRRFIKFKFDNKEKVVLYTEDNFNYYDLVNGKDYSTNNKERDYVIEETLVPTDISEYKTDYLYLLNKNKTKKKIKINSTRN